MKKYMILVLIALVFGTSALPASKQQLAAWFGDSPTNASSQASQRALQANLAPDVASKTSPSRPATPLGQAPINTSFGRALKPNHDTFRPSREFYGRIGDRKTGYTYPNGQYNFWANSHSLKSIKALVADEYANPNVRDEHGMTPLHIIVRLSGSFIEKERQLYYFYLNNLIAKNADVNAQDGQQGQTPIYQAIFANNIDMVVFLAPRTDLSLVDVHGNTALEHAYHWSFVCTRIRRILENETKKQEHAGVNRLDVDALQERIQAASNGEELGTSPLNPFASPMGVSDGNSPPFVPSTPPYDAAKLRSWFQAIENNKD